MAHGSKSTSAWKIGHPCVCGAIVRGRGGKCDRCRLEENRRHNQKNAELRPSWWTGFRKLILKRDGYRCTDCGSSEDLTVDYLPSGRHTKDTRLYLTRCRHCHGKRHGSGSTYPKPDMQIASRKNQAPAPPPPEYDSDTLYSPQESRVPRRMSNQAGYDEPRLLG